ANCSPPKRTARKQTRRRPRAQAGPKRGRSRRIRTFSSEGLSNTLLEALRFEGGLRHTPYQLTARAVWRLPAPLASDTSDIRIGLRMVLCSVARRHRWLLTEPRKTMPRRLLQELVVAPMRRLSGGSRTRTKTKTRTCSSGQTHRARLVYSGRMRRARRAY